MLSTSQQRTRELLLKAAAVACTVFGVFLVLALSSFSPDQLGGTAPSARNVCGPPGAWSANALLTAWGLGAFLVPAILFGFAIALFRGYRGERLSVRCTGCCLLVPAFCGLVHLLPDSRLAQELLTRWDQVQFGGLGGSLGWLLCGPAASGSAAPEGILLRHFDFWGSLLFLLIILGGGVALLHLGLTDLARRAWEGLREYVRKRQPAPLPPMPKLRTEPEAASEDAPRQTSFEDISRRIASSADDHEGPEAADLVARIRARRHELERTAGATLDEEETGTDAEEDDEEYEDDEEEDYEEEDEGDEEEAPKPKPRPKPKKKPRTRRKPTRRGATEDYEMPDFGMLSGAEKRSDSEHQREIDEIAHEIESSLQRFNIPVRVVGSTRGPVITQYEIDLQDETLRVSKLEGFEKDLALKLGTQGIRIVAPLPNKKTIGIEVPNRVKEAVAMREIVEEIDSDDYQIPLVLGRDVLGERMVGDLGKMPHLLVAGATGMGKSVCMNAMICSILMFRGPQEVKFIMVDPKMVELAGYDGIPHLLAPPITDMSKAHAALEWACKTMDERYYALRLMGVRNVIDYNKLGEKEIRKRLEAKGKDLDDLPGLETHMPYLVVLVDEYADLMMLNKEVERSIVRLTAKSRAAGIHIILTTQRPSADVVTGLIKSNLPARIAFRVTDKSNSRVVLDQGGAENLLGRGDMLYLPPGASTLVRGQGVWVKDPEIDKIIAHAKTQGEPEYDESIFKVGAAAVAAAEGDLSTGWTDDKKFHEAVHCVFRYAKTGADFLRRRMRIGYNSATSYVEQMEELGIVGPQQGTKPRELLVGWQDWIDLLEQYDVDYDADDEIYVDPMA